MAAFIFSGTSLKSPGFIQWGPTLTNHDPNPPISLEGSPSTIAPSSITSAETFGSPTVILASTLLPAGIASSEAFGNPTLIPAQTVSVTGIASAQAFGTANVFTGLFVSPESIQSLESFGVPFLIFNQTLILAGIGSELGFGTATLTLPSPPTPPIPPQTEPGCHVFGVGNCIGTPGNAAPLARKGRNTRSSLGNPVGTAGASDSISTI